MTPLVFNAKQRYREFCLQEKTIPIFSRDWWLDAVCGEGNWDVVLVENNDLIIGAMPYYKRSKFRITVLAQPLLTQTLGPWIRPSEAKYANELSYQKDVMEMLLQQLPKYGHFAQNWHSSITNWLPFFWKGFQQTTLYTYVLPDISDEKTLFSELRENIRREIRKASKRFSLQVRRDLLLEDFLALNRQTFERQKKIVPYEDVLLKKIDDACLKRNCREIFIAVDDQGRHHAGVYIIWDENSAYYLMGGGDPSLRNSGATSLCMWEAIRYASKVTKKFDFEGSMIEPIERFFRAFGAIQTPYFQVSRTPSRLLRVGKFLREMRNN